MGKGARKLRENVEILFDILVGRCQRRSIFTFILEMREKLRFIYHRNDLYTCTFMVIQLKSGKNDPKNARQGAFIDIHCQHKATPPNLPD